MSNRYVLELVFPQARRKPAGSVAGLEPGVVGRSRTLARVFRTPVGGERVCAAHRSLKKLAITAHYRKPSVTV